MPDSRHINVIAVQNLRILMHINHEVYIHRYNDLHLNKIQYFTRLPHEHIEITTVQRDVWIFKD